MLRTISVVTALAVAVAEAFGTRVNSREPVEGPRISRLDPVRHGNGCLLADAEIFGKEGKVRRRKAGHPTVLRRAIPISA